MFLLICLLSIGIGINAGLYYWFITVVLEAIHGPSNMRVLNICYIPITGGLAFGGSKILWWITTNTTF